MLIPGPAAVGVGVSSLSKSGSAALTGAVTLAGIGQASVTQSGQAITMNVPAVPTSRSWYTGNQNSIGAGSNGYVTWDTLFAGDGQLGFAAPWGHNEPYILTAGKYYIQAQVRCTALAVGQVFRIQLDWDKYDEEVLVEGFSHPATAAYPNPVACIDFVWQLTQGGPAAGDPPAGGANIQILAFNPDVSARNFELLNGFITRLA